MLNTYSFRFHQIAVYKLDQHAIKGPLLVLSSAFITENGQHLFVSNVEDELIISTAMQMSGPSLPVKATYHSTVGEDL